MYSLATDIGIGFLPWARSFARPAAVRLIAAKPCWAPLTLGITSFPSSPDIGAMPYAIALGVLFALAHRSWKSAYRVRWELEKSTA
jgi:hypothetical protein